jgi:hypothetical protein
MKANASLRVPFNDVKGNHGFARTDGRSGFLKNFALGRLLKRFPDFNTTAGNGPEALGRGLAALDQQDATVTKHDRTDRHPWLAGIGIAIGFGRGPHR